MLDVKQEITSALAVLSTLAVSGDAVDVMAVARAKLKAILAQLEQEAKDDA